MLSQCSVTPGGAVAPDSLQQLPETMEVKPSECQKTNSLISLPDEILCSIMVRITDPITALEFGLVCKRFHAMSQTEALWRDWFLLNYSPFISRCLALSNRAPPPPGSRLLLIKVVSRCCTLCRNEKIATSSGYCSDCTWTLCPPQCDPQPSHQPCKPS